ncbi:phosphoenolpyruvate-protein phosphotransferase PtsP, partial [Pseudomonas syringae]
EVIRTGTRAQSVLRWVVSENVKRFGRRADAYLRGRATDVKDLGGRLLAYLHEERQQALVYHDNTILVSEELTPAMHGEVPEGKLVGLASVQGSGNSHVAILARAMGIPPVLGLVAFPSPKVARTHLVGARHPRASFTNPTPLIPPNSATRESRERPTPPGP